MCNLKKIVINITIILLITIITVGATFAYLSATTNSDRNVITSDSAQLIVKYTGGMHIDGTISMSKDKTGGRNTTVNISQDENSVNAKANLFINIDSISSQLATEGFIWEVYKVVDDEEIYVNDGTFATCQSGETSRKCAKGDRIYIVNDYVLSIENTAFKVYVWLDGNQVGNEVLGTSFSGTIAAETERYTGHLQ